MSCSIKNCNNQAIEELLLANGEIKSFCKKSYYHSATGWIISRKSEKNYRQTEKGKKTIKRLRNKPEYKEKNKQRSKVYYQKNREKLIKYAINYYSNLTEEQLKARNRRAHVILSLETKTKRNIQKKQFRQAIKECGLTEKQYKEFKDKLIEEKGNKCEICGVSKKEKRLISHHIKHYIPDYKLLIQKSNCLILCDKHHKRLHTIQK